MSGFSSPRELSRCRHRQAAQVPDQQLHPARFNHRANLQAALAGGALLSLVKQHLRIKAFYGTTENSVKTQIWIADSVYVLVAIVRKRLRMEASHYQILQILSVTLFEKTPFYGHFSHPVPKMTYVATAIN